MNRRAFLGGITAVAAFPPISRAMEAFDSKIKRIRISTLHGRFHKFVAMNAYDTEPKGNSYRHSLIRVETDSGVEGLAPGVYRDLCTAGYAHQLQPLIGARISDLYVFNRDRVVARGPRFASLLAANRHLDFAFFDIFGKLMQRPAWALIGSEGTSRIRVYDGTLYFSDVWYRERGIAAVVDECTEAIRAGFSGVKMKLGRGWKWMDRKAGNRRDIEVTLAVRDAIGSDAELMADPNYGYRDQYDGALELMHDIAPARLLWMEEIFPESPTTYTRFRKDLKKADNMCGIAFGEHLFAVDAIIPYTHPDRLVDFVQYDIRGNGFLDNAILAQNLSAYGILIANHNWASQMGYIGNLHLARALGNYGPAECDRSVCDVLRCEQFPLRGGTVPAPSHPGLGITVDEDVYRRDHAASEIVISCA